MRQTIKPSKIILWLGKDHFSSVADLPVEIRNQVKRGLEIKFREDLKPHTKYYYAMRENPESPIVTVDDDTFYPSNVLEELLKYHRRFPNAIICNGARIIKIKDNGFENYRVWENWYSDYAKKIEKCERYDLLPLGVMGVLYPEGSLDREVFNIESIKKTSLKADDLWLKAMAIKKGTSTLLTYSYPKAFVSLPDTQSQTLMNYNLEQGQNDKQLQAIDQEYGIFNIYKSLLDNHTFKLLSVTEKQQESQ
jgi:hypothetical protein